MRRQASVADMVRWTRYTLIRIRDKTCTLPAERAVDADVIFCHPCGGEPLVEALANAAPVQGQKSWKDRDRLVFRLDDPAGDPVVDHFRHRAAAEREHR